MHQVWIFQLVKNLGMDGVRVVTVEGLYLELYKEKLMPLSGQAAEMN